MSRIPILRFVCLGCVLGLLCTVLLPMVALADAGTATFFIAHPDSHAEAAPNNPLVIVGGMPGSFEVRMRDAGTVEKAGWQTILSIDACEFEIPSVSAIVMGDMFGTSVPVRQVLPVQDDLIKVKVGQVLLPGSISSADGLLATVTLTPKAQRACPSGAAGTNPAEISFAPAPSTQWSAPGGVKLQFQTRSGYLTRGPGAVTLVQFEAAATGVSWLLILPATLAVLAGAIALTGVLVRRSHREPQ
jgi:hypothetical protein